MKNKILIIILIILIVILGIVMFIPKNNNNISNNTVQDAENKEVETAPNKEKIENIVKEFYSAYYCGDVEKALKLIDFAGMEVYTALSEENDDLSKFKEAYNIYIKSEDWKKYKEQIDTSLNSMIENLKNTLNNVEVKETNVTNPRITEVSKDLFEVIVNIEEKDENGNITASEDFKHYVLKVNDEYKIVYAEE